MSITASATDIAVSISVAAAWRECAVRDGFSNSRFMFSPS